MFQIIRIKVSEPYITDFVIIGLCSNTCEAIVFQTLYDRHHEPLFFQT